MPVAVVRHQHRLDYTAGIAIDLLCWARLLVDGLLTKAQLTTLAYLLLHAAAHLVCHSRRPILHIPGTSP